MPFLGGMPMTRSSESPVREEPPGPVDGLGVLPLGNPQCPTPLSPLLPPLMALLADATGSSYWRPWRLVGTPSWRFRHYRKLRRLARPFGIERLRYHLRARRFARLEKSASLVRADARLLTKLRSKNLVFTVTAGRTGTTLLTSLLKLLPDTTALHEPEPAFEHYLRRVQRNPAAAKEFLLQYKLPAIAQYRTTNYAELSNVFAKVFLEPLLELGLTPNLVILRRHPRLIALSYMERYVIPERTVYGLEFLLGPRDPGTLPLPRWYRMTDYQLIFWYALEMERRQQAYRELRLRHGGKLFDVTVDELHDPERFLALAETLRLIQPDFDCDSLREQLPPVLRRRHNRHIFKIVSVSNLDAQEEEIWHAVSQAVPTLRSQVEGRYAAAGH